jgi:hypothetical protein
MADYATLLREHVTLTCRSVDRIFLQAYVPKLQTVGWVCQFLRWQRGYEIPSSAAFGKIGDGYVREIYRIGYTAMDNGFHRCDDPEALQRVCDRLGPGAVKSFFWRWQRRLPSPLTRDDLRAGYVYDLAFRQFEVSDTRVFDRPAAGRSFFEQLISDHLDVGRPDSVSLIFDKRVTARTPGTFRTKVITKGVDPQVNCHYRSSRIKQYFREHRALRTETVICNTRDFGIGRRVTAENWIALRAVGEAANQRLCDAQAADARPAPDVVTFSEVTRPSTVDGQHAAGLRFGDPRVMAVMAAIVGFTHLLAGFDNPALVRLVTTLLDQPYTSRQATYDLRRLKRKGLIVRLPGRHRYQLTALGRRVAVLFTKTYNRVLAPGLAALDPRLPPELARRSPPRHRLAAARSHPRPIHQHHTHHDLNLQLGLTVNFGASKRRRASEASPATSTLLIPSLAASGSPNQ